MKQKKRKNSFYYDHWLLLAALPLIAIGLLMVASSSMVISDRVYGYPFYYLFRQATFIGLGFVLALIVIRIPLAFWLRASGYLLLLCFLLLVLVLIPGIGRVVNGSARWINLGIAAFQVSELAKFCFVVYLASYITRHQDEVRYQTMGFIKPMLVLAVAAVLLLLEPDFGAIAVISATALGVMFLSGVRLRNFLVVLVCVAAVLAILAVSSPYRMQRLTTFLHPWANPFSSGYQLTQSLIAFGRGGIFGVGLGNSVQKLFYLPEAHTDFLFAVLAEELGLLGELMVIGFYVLLVGRVLHIARKTYRMGNIFAGLMAYGFGLWLGMQAMINIGVNAGLLPTKGLTLPLMSYGGSSMLVSCVVLALLLRIQHETSTKSTEVIVKSYQHRAPTYKAKRRLRRART